MNYDLYYGVYDFMDLTYAIGPCMDLLELIWDFETCLHLFEIFYGHTHALEYLCYGVGPWTLDYGLLDSADNTIIWCVGDEDKIRR